MNRINKDYIEAYIDSLCHFKGSTYMNLVKEEGIRKGLPILREPAACFINILVKSLHVKRVLEIGTSIGYSTMVLLYAMGYQGEVTTIEMDEELINYAKKYLKNANLWDRVTLFQGDAGEILQHMEGQFDLIFMDGPKAQYINYLPYCIKLLRIGGLLICDDVLFYGMVANNSLIKRKKLTIVKRMRDFLKTITNHDQLDTTIIPIGDGISMSIKTK